MKLIDRIKLAIHNLWHNKSRSLLTIVIVFVVSTLILIIMLMGINFFRNLNKLQQRAISTSVPSVYFYKYKNDGERDMQTHFDVEDIDFVLEKSRKYQAVNHSMSFEKSQNFMYHPLLNQKLSNNYIAQLYNSSLNASMTTNLVSFAFPNNNQKRLVDGRIWSINDVGLNNIWVNSSFVRDQESKGKIIRIGEVVWLHSRATSTVTNPVGSFHSQSFIVQGIIDDNLDGSNVYIDLTYISRNYPLDVIANRIQLDFYPPKREYKFDEVYNAIDDFTKEVRISLESKSSDQFIIKSASELMDQLKITKLISIIVVGLSVMLSILILLLSIGSIANTIVISVDKNKKFIGLLKAIGLKQKEVVNVVQIEAIFTISIGVILSTSVIALNSNNFQLFLNDLFNALSFQSTLLNVQILFEIPFYLPISVIIIFLALALVFSRGSLTQIARMDVINIISEVS